MTLAERLIEQVVAGRQLALPLNESVKHLKKMPPNTSLHPVGMWSMWDGQIAVVDAPLYSAYDAYEHDFNPATYERHYNVWFAINLDTKKPYTNKELVDRQYNVRDGNKSFEHSTWVTNLGGFPARAIGGGFTKLQEFWVAIPLKNLSPGEMKAVVTHLHTQGYFDVSSVRYKVSKADWAKIIKMDFMDVQNLDSEIANAADQLVTQLLNDSSYSDNAAKRAWNEIEGVFMTARNGNIVWIAKRK